MNMAYLCTTLLMLLLVFDFSLAKVAVVTALFGGLPFDLNISYVQNFMAMNFRLIMYSDFKSIRQLKQLGFDDDRRITYIETTVQDFAVKTLLGINTDYHWVLPIERLFMISSAITQFETEGIDVYCWVDIDSFQDLELFPLFLGFPDSRKIQGPNSKIVAVTEEYKLTSKGDSRDTSVISILTGNVLIGGSIIWQRLRDESLLLLLDSMTNSAEQNFDTYWSERLISMNSQAINLTNTLETIEIGNIYLNLLYWRSKELFCHFPGKIAHFYYSSLQRKHYLLYQYSYNPIADNDTRCIDEAYYKSQVEDFHLVDLLFGSSSDLPLEKNEDSTQLIDPIDNLQNQEINKIADNTEVNISFAC